MSESWMIAIFGGALTVILAIVGGLITRVLLAIDSNQKDLAESIRTLWTSHSELSENFHELRGEHRINHKLGGHNG